MPTPFYHLSIAAELLESPALPAGVHAFLRSERCAFLLGKTAPDVQTLSGQERPETHFYRMVDQILPWERLFTAYPALADSASLPPSQAAFTAGYICHLQADIIWISDLFLPYFLPRISLGQRKRMSTLHNVLRAHLDEQILPDLPGGIGECLQHVNPDGWLPFVPDQAMSAWRDFVAQQLLPGASSQTSELFAERLGISTEEFNLILHNEAQLEAELFSFIPQAALVEYRQKLVAANLELLSQYLSGAAGKGV